MRKTINKIRKEILKPGPCGKFNGFTLKQLCKIHDDIIPYYGVAKETRVLAVAIACTKNRKEMR